MASSNRVLNKELLERCHERAPQYDRENRFAQEDFEELRDSGYLNMAVPKEMGGGGMSMAETAAQTRKLAYYAPPTALALNMHVYWTGLAADLRRAGDTSLEWLLEEAAAGEIFAAGHSESGNTVPVLLSSTQAKRVDGGYTFTGRKGFASLSPVWTRYGMHGIDTSDPAAPKIVHGFMSRDAKGYSVKETWDVMGMRATRSDDVILEEAFVPDRYIARIVPAGAAGVDPFIVGLFGWALIGFANVYCGLAQRVRDITIAAVQGKTALGMTRSMAYHPEIQHGVAEMFVELEAMAAHMEKVATDWSNAAEHTAEWVPRIVAAKYHAVEAAWRVVDTAMDLSGGLGMFRKNELERLFRDARAGRFHPTNSALTHELLGKMVLGISPDEQPRWG